MKLKFLTLTCALGLLALGTGIKAADTTPCEERDICKKGTPGYGFVT
jgi:hypothetical protein